jgi:hypothetical protein
MLERLIEYINGHEGVRWATFEEIDADFRERYPRSGKARPESVIEAFDQPELRIEMLGRSEVTASGKVGKLDLQLQGSGWADLSGLIAGDAEVSVSGSRDALLAATGRARISGNGAVVLVTQPRQVELDLGESGRVFSLGAVQAARQAE